MNITNADHFTFNVHDSLLVVGRTGSGKSYLVRRLIKRLESTYSSLEFKEALFDLKCVEFCNPSDIRQEYLYFDVVEDPIVGLFRLKALAIESKLRSLKTGHKPMIFIYIEECDMALLHQKQFDAALIMLNENAHSANMKVIYSTSRVDEQAISEKLINSFELILVGPLGSGEDYSRLNIPMPVQHTKYNFIVSERDN